MAYHACSDPLLGNHAIQRGGLAGSVGTEEAKYLPRLHGQGHPRHRHPMGGEAVLAPRATTPGPLLPLVAKLLPEPME
jgi:hypothetical protein